jgi:hypothetical protein
MNRVLRAVAQCSCVCRSNIHENCHISSSELLLCLPHTAKERALSEMLVCLPNYTLSRHYDSSDCVYTAVSITSAVDTVMIRKKYFILSAKRAAHSHLNIRICGWKVLYCNGVPSRCNHGYLEQKEPRPPAPTLGFKNWITKRKNILRVTIHQAQSST